MLQIYLHNTLKQQKQLFEPIDSQNVRMYVCGPTVYDKAHLGNARPPVVYDVLYRLFIYVYGKNHVTYVSNITDVDDKILNKHKQTGKSIQEITQETYNWYIEDMKKLNVLEPNARPRATQYIPEMIDLVKKLLDNGHAYESENQVLFDVDSMPAYGSLSGRSLKEMIAGARIDVAEYKKNPADFILWKPSDPSEPGWNSPWGYGRPGWHLECSAMSAKLLGNDFDIHGGGSDLIFPHHENEYAQSCGAHKGSHFAHYWVHTGMLMINGVKMSKSLGNFYTVDEILEKHPAEALRLLFLTTHYHQPFNFTLEGLEEAKKVLDKFYNALLKTKDVKVFEKQPSQKLLEALADDLNTPLALSYLHELVNLLNKAETNEQKADIKSQLMADSQMLGLLYQDPQVWFQGEEGHLDVLQIEEMIEKRTQAKKSKDFGLADSIRNELKAKGIILEDTPSGTTWKKA